MTPASIPCYRAIMVIPHQQAGDITFAERPAQPGVPAGRDPMASTRCGIQIATTLVTLAGGPVRCPACKAPDEIWYGGADGTPRGDGRAVWIMDVAGLPCGRLPEVIRPGYGSSGFTWGYPGVGPRALARSLLVHALGPAAICGMCTGTGRVTYPLGYEGGDLPAAPYDPARSGQAYQEAGLVVDQCWGEGCDWGSLVSPSAVQQFKRQIVGRWEGAWRISRAEILQWVAGQSRD